jgi:arylsulfatase A
VSEFSRREFARVLLASGALLPFGEVVAAVASQSERPPNIAFFLSDDLGYGDLHCYGNPINQTPNLDRFATEGCRFTDAHSASPVCSPARGALLTGRNPYRLGFYDILSSDMHLRRQEITVAQLLKQRGYDTCFVGKWHLTKLGEHSQGQPTPGDFGFDYWFATEHNAFEGPHNPKDFFRNDVRVGPVDGWYCDVIVREALEWLAKRPDPSRPFFVHVCSHEPHTPIGPPGEYAGMYDNAEVQRLSKAIHYGGVQRPDKDLSANAKYYYGTVTQLDAAFGRLMTGLDAMDLRSRTAVFFTSDNGPEYPVNFEESHGEWEDPIRDRSFGTPGSLRGMKRFTYEGGHRVPLIIRWPGHVQPDTTSEAFVDGTDFLPTLCQMAGTAVPTDRTIDGASIVPVFSGRPVERKIPACWLFPVPYTFVPNIAMRDGHEVIVAWFNPKRDGQSWMDYIKTAKPERYELYDLRSDLPERHDLAASEPARAKALAAKLDRVWLDIQAEAPVWKEWGSQK